MARNKPWAARWRTGLRSQIEEYPIATGETIAPGDILELDGGELKKLTAAGDFFGLALSGTDQYYVFPSLGLVDVFVPSTLYAFTGTADPELADKGTDGALVYDDGAWAVDPGEGEDVRIVDVDLRRKLFFVSFNPIVAPEEENGGQT